MSDNTSAQFQALKEATSANKSEISLPKISQFADGIISVYRSNIPSPLVRDVTISKSCRKWVISRFVAASEERSDTESDELGIHK